MKNALFTNEKKPVIMIGLCTGGSMDRASDSGSEGWGFESLPVYQKKAAGWAAFFWYTGRGLSYICLRRAKFALQAKLAYAS